MKVLLINGSPKHSGNTAFALAQMDEVFQSAGVQTEIIQVGSQTVRGCTGCASCYKTHKCVFDDLVNETAAKLEEADGIVLGSPVYYASPNGTLLSFLDRLFYSTKADLRMKVGASIVSCRRGGNSASFESLNQFFGINGMPTVPSTYWNDVHGFTADDVYADEEGVQTVRNLARNMAFMMRAIADARATHEVPEKNKVLFTNFIR
jgi:multimeric flavodoxin WrbA